MLEDLNVCSHLISLIILKLLEDKPQAGGGGGREGSFIAEFTVVGIMPGTKDLPNKYLRLVK